MEFMSYLSCNWGLLLLLVGMAMIMFSDIHLERKMIKRIVMTNIMLFVYSVSYFEENFFGQQSEYSIMRAILTATNYTLVSFILVSIITIMFPMQKFIVYIPALFGAIMCFLSIPTHIVFYFTDDNRFMRGPLGYLPYCVAGIYFIYLLYNVFFKSRAEKEDYLVLIFITLMSVICFILPLTIPEESDRWFTFTIAFSVFLYYVFLLQQFTKRDPLTKLLNRQSYYTDSVKYGKFITAFVIMDMNGLKLLNDSEGHVAGDKGLSALADCFWSSAQLGQRAYRIGGDEYVILCLGATEDDVKALIGRIREKVDKIPYSCSIGYAMRNKGETIDELYNMADKMMYEEKQRYYISIGKEER